MTTIPYLAQEIFLAKKVINNRVIIIEDIPIDYDNYSHIRVLVRHSSFSALPLMITSYNIPQPGYVLYVCAILKKNEEVMYSGGLCHNLISDKYFSENGLLESYYMLNMKMVTNLFIKFSLLNNIYVKSQNIKTSLISKFAIDMTLSYQNYI